MNEIWILLKKYKFNIVTDTNKNILCTICNGLIINAHSSPCGCVYCFDCIRDYLDRMEKFCPGKTVDCQKEKININTNVFLDHRMNKKISRTIVKCPERNCVFKDELGTIGDHIRVCDARSVECPFMNIGCKVVDVVEVHLKKHLLEEIVGHSKLMLDSMDNFRNEMELMKKNVTVLTMENKDLKKEIIDLKMEETVSKIKDLKSKIENQNEEIKEMKKKFEEREMKREENYDRFMEKIDEMSTVKDKMKEMETNSIMEFESMKNKISLNKNMMEKVKKMCEEEKKNVKVLKCNGERMGNKCDRDKVKFRSLFLCEEEFFNFLYDNFHEQILSRIYFH